MTRLLCALLLALALSPPAHAAPRFVRLQDGPPIVTDGRRFALIVQDESAVVTDTRDGSRKAIGRPAANCFFRAAGGGHALWECGLPGFRDTPRIFDLETGAEVEVGGRETYEMLSDASGTNGIGIARITLGSTWMVGVAEPCYHCEQYFHLNWRTGEMAKRLGGARDVQDLDAERGHRRACAPARRRWQHTGDHSEYDPPWSRLVAAGAWYVERNRLRRCGSGKLARRLRGASRLTRTHAVWLHGRTVTVRHLATGREATRRLSMVHHAGASLHIAGDRAYVGDGSGGAGPRRRWRIELR